MTRPFRFLLGVITVITIASGALAQTGAPDSASVPPPPPPAPSMVMAPMPTIQTGSVNNEALVKRIHSPLLIISDHTKASNTSDGGQSTSHLVTAVDNYRY